MYGYASLSGGSLLASVGSLGGDKGKGHAFDPEEDDGDDGKEKVVSQKLEDAGTNVEG